MRDTTWNCLALYPSMRGGKDSPAGLLKPIHLGFPSLSPRFHIPMPKKIKCFLINHGM